MPELREKAVLVKLSISQWTARKQDKAVEKEVEEKHNAHDAGKYNKYLLAKKLDAISKLVNEVRTTHYFLTLPWTLDGLDILPSKMFLEYSQKMNAFKTKFHDETSAFFGKYPEYVEEDKARLNGLFNPADYPTIKQLKRKFDFTVTFYPIPAKEDFRLDINKEELDRMKTDLEKELKDQTAEATKHIWERLQKTVAHMTDRLQDPEAKFKNSLVNNLVELVQILPKLNLNDDPEIEKARRDIEDKLTAYDPQELRENPEARKETATAARHILETIKPHLDTGDNNGDTEEPTPAKAPEAPTAAPEALPLFAGKAPAENTNGGKEEPQKAPEANDDAAKLDAMATLF